MTNKSLPWRSFLTDDERQIIEGADAAKLVWQALNDRRTGIVNRAIQRARYAMGLRGPKADAPGSDAVRAALGLRPTSQTEVNPIFRDPRKGRL